ncbi:MAG: dTDP-4-dehydrorhamnose 3,5-epimerase [Anaerolinea sp.]|nr:dTDP-4-dehydrorhamnose 3,5-epimerase [Anaerolinea sp.]
MIFTPTKLREVIVIEPKVFIDQRGFFMESFQKKSFANAGINCEFVQDNHSGSGKGILRGLHYQLKQTQGKLVRALIGEVFDVAVDIRVGSPTFGQWVGEFLSAENKKQLWVPPGFAHGFFVVSEWAEIVYKASDYYSPEWERTILWSDPEIGINWPIVEGEKPIVSEKDALGKLLSEADLFK